jgi:hypothetical protein
MTLTPVNPATGAASEIAFISSDASSSISQSCDKKNIKN